MVRAVLVLIAVIALTACTDDATIEDTATTTTTIPLARPADPPPGEEPTLQDLLATTDALDTYRFTWLIRIDPGDSAPAEEVRIAGAVDRPSDSVVWHVDIGGVSGADAGTSYAILRLDGELFARGLVNLEVPDDIDVEGFLPTDDLSMFPDWFTDPAAGPARLPTLLFSLSETPQLDGNELSGVVDPRALSPESLEQLTSALDLRLEDDFVRVTGTHAAGVVATMQISTSTASGNVIMEIAIKPDARVEFPDVEDPDADPTAWFDEFLEAFMAAAEQPTEETSPLDEALGLFSVPDVSELDTDTAFCTIYGNLPYRWATDALVPAQLWLDHARVAATTTPTDIAEPFEVMLGFWEQRMDWQFTGGERPPFTDEMEAAERAVARWAVDNCEIPQIPPTTPITAGGYNEFTCDFERRWLDEAQAEYFAEFGTYATHLHILETHTDTFVATDHIEIGAADDEGYEVVIVPDGACDGS